MRWEANSFRFEGPQPGVGGGAKCRLSAESAGIQIVSIVRVYGFTGAGDQSLKGGEGRHVPSCLLGAYTLHCVLSSQAATPG